MLVLVVNHIQRRHVWVTHFSGFIIALHSDKIKCYHYYYIGLGFIEGKVKPMRISFMILQQLRKFLIYYVGVTQRLLFFS